MAAIKQLTSITIIFTLFIKIQSKELALHRDVRENRRDPCDTTQFNDADKIQCYCRMASVETTSFIVGADCLIVNNIQPDDDDWKSFYSVRSLERILFSSKGENRLTYVPTSALKTLHDLIAVTIKLGRIETIHPYAFANLSYVQEIKLTGNEIQNLAMHAFAHHPNLTSITLDSNRITEIKRQVFKALPELQVLYLTDNNISIIHDRAFIHLGSLRELELEKNSIFVLTNETFLGLVNVTRLELGYNNLEVIGDNTFAHLKSLRSLNLDNNKIKMLDDKAFHGLSKLESLYLSNNKLKELKSPKVFSSLTSLMYLNLKSNGMHLLAGEVIAPIIKNFYLKGSNIGFEENEYPCDCKLNWFLSLKNHTSNDRLRTAIDNLLCYPSAKLAEEFQKLEENEKIDSGEDNKNLADADYEYYDDKSLKGRLFFSDIPAYLVPCPNNPPNPLPVPGKSKSEATTAKHVEISKQTTQYTPKTLVTTVRTIVVPKKRQTLSKIETTTFKHSSTVEREFDASSETIVKDAYEPVPTFETTVKTPPIRKTVVPSVQTSTPKHNNEMVKDSAIMKDEKPNIKVYSGTESTAESLSHVNVSSATTMFSAKTVVLFVLVSARLLL